ncbi:MAG: hypothetical protein COC08_01835 [Maribacter sp.]|nr:MAG: hypothetical protein COC08_01835 [Maribacter sp.]
MLEQTIKHFCCQTTKKSGTNGITKVFSRNQTAFQPFIAYRTSFQIKLLCLDHTTTYYKKYTAET